jgi:hypothetical protein
MGVPAVFGSGCSRIRYRGKPEKFLINPKTRKKGPARKKLKTKAG